MKMRLSLAICLAGAAGFLPRKTRVCTDATGLNNFLIATKAA